MKQRRWEWGGNLKVPWLPNPVPAGSRLENAVRGAAGIAVMFSHRSQRKRDKKEAGNSLQDTG